MRLFLVNNHFPLLCCFLFGHANIWKWTLSTCHEQPDSLHTAFGKAQCGRTLSRLSDAVHATVRQIRHFFIDNIHGSNHIGTIYVYKHDVLNKYNIITTGTDPAAETAIQPQIWCSQGWFPNLSPYPEKCFLHRHGYECHSPLYTFLTAEVPRDCS